MKFCLGNVVIHREMSKMDVINRLNIHNLVISVLFVFFLVLNIIIQ